MKKQVTKRGRPNQIREPTVVVTFNITEMQRAWIELEVFVEGMSSASDFMRKIITEAMLRRSVDPKDPPQD